MSPVGEKREIDPGVVFTPARPVQPHMWASRERSGGAAAGVQRRLEDRLSEPGRQIVLYGDTGVGKTSLVEHVCNAKRIGYIRVECGQSFTDMLQEALGKAGTAKEHLEVKTISKGEGGVRGRLPIGPHSSWERQDVEEQTSTTYPVSLATILREDFPKADIGVLFFDNFENVRSQPHAEDVTRDLAQFMKSCADAGALKVVVAGIPAESEVLVALDEATSRRTSEIEVPRMRDEELDEILTKGEGILKIDFDSDCRTTIIRYSDGFPYYTHLLALHATRAALAGGSKKVTITHFMTALGEILEDAELSLRRMYREAAETSGDVKVRKSIMMAVACQEKTEVTFGEIKVGFQRIHPHYELSRLNFISVGLGALVEQHGVLQSRGNPRSANRTYRFANPLMRTYLRLRDLQQQPG
jgi:hypothetical protein